MMKRTSRDFPLKILLPFSAYIVCRHVLKRVNSLDNAGDGGLEAIAYEIRPMSVATKSLGVTRCAGSAGSSKSKTPMEEPPRPHAIKYSRK